MPRVVIELTNRCNLSCEHCFSGRHGGKDDLPLEVLRRILTEAGTQGFDHLSFTGGDPTLHRQFAEILRLTHEAGYRFGLVTNGWNFPRIYPLLGGYRETLDVITFSLDGATEPSHDRIRGKNSYRRVLQAMSICLVQGLPFTINMVVTAHNRDELRAMVATAVRLGARGVRFGHLMPAPLTTAQGLDLAPEERKRAEAEIAALRRESPIPVAMAPGYHTTDLFPCGPLQMVELNVDCQGNLTKCCHLSGHGEGVGAGDVVGSLLEMTFAEGYRRLAEENAEFHRAKTACLRRATLSDTDYFACWYCSLHYDKVSWLRDVAGHPWRDAMRSSHPVAGGRNEGSGGEA